MNKTVLLCCSTLYLAAAWSQPTLNSPTVPPNGYSSEILAAAFIAPTAGSEVAQSWDFSDVNGNVVNTLGVNLATTSLYAPMFPQAEWVMSNGDQLSFLDFAESGLTLYGNANTANGVTFPFEDPLTQWPYPMVFGFYHEDAFSTDQVLFSEPYSLQGNVTSTCDAWGSIVLPNGVVISEVLRVDYNQFYVETYAGDTANWYLNQVMYCAPDSVLPVFFHEELVVTDNAGEELLNVTDVAWYDNTVLSVDEDVMVVGALAWPNPIERGSAVNLRGARSGGFVMDLGGRTVWTCQEAQSDVLQVSTKDWRSGPYLYVPYKGAHPIRIIVQ